MDVASPTCVDAPVRINLFGSAAVTCGGRRIDRRLAESTLLVLARLVTRPGWTHRRDELAFELWPDRSEPEARASLRRHLYVLHNELPAAAAAHFEATVKTIAWHARDAWVDVNEFIRLTETADDVEAAVYLYGGDFLAHVDHDWANGLREALHRRYCRALERSIERRRSGDDVIGSLRYIEALLQADPWREDMLREQMLLRARIGDRAGALAAYDRFRRRMICELAATPMAETVARRDAIAAGNA
jgi:DNA-binding SARP family transcriptional activator